MGKEYKVLPGFGNMWTLAAAVEMAAKDEFSWANGERFQLQKIADGIRARCDAALRGNELPQDSGAMEKENGYILWVRGLGDLYLATSTADGWRIGQLPRLVRAEEAVREYAEAWIDRLRDNDKLDEWEGMEYPEFCQALHNANAPSFGFQNAMEGAMESLAKEWKDPEDMWELFGDVAYDAAWDRLQVLLREQADEENA